jgi:hypothetical protein
MTPDIFMSFTLYRRVEMLRTEGMYLTGHLCGDEADVVHAFYFIRGFYVEVKQALQGFEFMEFHAFHEHEDRMGALLDDIDFLELSEFLEDRFPF